MSAKPTPTDPPFTVMATIHGPEGWHDVIDTKAGSIVVVCPKRCLAKRIAALLTEERSAK